MKDALGQEIMAGDWVGYPGHQGSGRAYVSVGVVVEVRELTIRIVPYGQLMAGSIDIHKSCGDDGLTRPFRRPAYMSGTLRLPPCELLQTTQAAAFRARALVRFGTEGEPTRCPLCLGRGFIQSGDELLDGEYVRVLLCSCYVADIHRRAKELKKDSTRYMYLASNHLRSPAEQSEMLLLRGDLATRGVTFDWEPVPRDHEVLP